MSQEIEMLAKAMGQGKDNDEMEVPQTGSSHKPYSAMSKFDIYRVDYGWVDKTENKKELKLAYEALKEDAGFPDLIKYTLKKLKQVDKNYKTEEDFNKYTPAEALEANNDVSDFLRDM